jgi:hypothetical protein
MVIQCRPSILQISVLYASTFECLSLGNDSILCLLGLLVIRYLLYTVSTLYCLLLIMLYVVKIDYIHDNDELITFISFFKMSLHIILHIKLGPVQVYRLVHK